MALANCLSDLNSIIENLGPLFWKKGRLATYKNWPFNDKNKCSPGRMAAAGFFAAGDDDEFDSAECFVCGKQLNGWEAEDDPWEEHNKHQVNCPFIAIGAKEENKYTIEEFFTLVKAFKIRTLKKSLEKIEENTKVSWKEKENEIREHFSKKK